MEGRVRLGFQAWMVWVLATAALGATPIQLPPQKDSWVRGASAHFVYYSNAGETRIRELARHLELLVDSLARTRGSKASPAPTAVYVFRDDRSFAPYKRNPDGTVQNRAGFFARNELGNYIVMDGSVETPRVILHEYLHQFAAYNLPALPPWLSEGLAEFYSTFSATEKAAKLGRPVSEHVHLLRGEPMIPLPRLFEITHDSPEYNESTKQGVFYAESWALVHLLTIGKPERRPQINAFVERLRQGQTGAEALAALGDLQALTGELQTYVKQNAFTVVTQTYGERSVDVGVRFTALDRPDVLFRLGDLLLRTDHAEDAAAHFRAALALAPDHAGAVGGLAVLDAEAGKWKEAAAGFARAVAAAPDDPELRLRLAQALYVGATEGGAAAALEKTPAQLLQAREHAARAAALRPDLFEAFYLQGLSYAFDNEGVEPGIEALKRAAALAPGRLDALLALGGLQLVAGQTDAAKGTFGEVLRRSSDREEVRQARAALAEVCVVEALEEAERTHDPVKAAATIRAALPDLDPSRRAETEKLLGQLQNIPPGSRFTEEDIAAPEPASTDAQAHLRFAAQQSQAAGEKGGTTGQRLAQQAVMHFKRAAELEPENAEAWLGWAMSCVRALCPTKEGMAAAEKGLSLRPGDVWATYLLANYRIDAGQYAEARELVAPLLDVEHPMRDEIRYTDVWSRLKEAGKLLEDAKPKQALRLLDVPRMPEGRLGEVASRSLAETREGAETNLWLEKLGEGRAARLGGQSDKARRILENVVAHCPHKEIVQEADRELAYIRAASNFK